MRLQGGEKRPVIADAKLGRQHKWDRIMHTEIVGGQMELAYGSIGRVTQQKSRFGGQGCCTGRKRRTFIPYLMMLATECHVDG